jgi:hypothetical protein
MIRSYEIIKRPDELGGGWWADRCMGGVPLTSCLAFHGNFPQPTPG